MAPSERQLTANGRPNGPAILDPKHMSVKGVAFLHPLRNRKVIDTFYNERRTEGELDAKLDPAGEELINGTIPEGW